MTKKDFQLIANALAAAKASDLVIEIMAITLAKEWDRFDKAVFIKACKQAR